jgi:hypothetical protein
MPAFRTSDSPGTNQILAARAGHEGQVGWRAFIPQQQWRIVRLAPERTVNERSAQNLTSPLPERALGSHVVIFLGRPPSASAITPPCGIYPAGSALGDRFNTQLIQQVHCVGSSVRRVENRDLVATETASIPRGPV